jgi:predicted  nucleic acid-binding Zn-ribbon protein
MFNEEVTVSKLSEKISDLLARFDELKSQNEMLRQEVVTLKAQNEAKDSQIQSLEEKLMSKEIETEEILSKIEEVLGR